VPVEVLVWPDAVVHVEVTVDVDGELVAADDVFAVEVLVFQAAEEPFDHAVGLSFVHVGGVRR